MRKKSLVRKPEGKRPLGRPSRRLEYDVMNLAEIVFEAWVGLI
jgi:hypothetical protein